MMKRATGAQRNENHATLGRFRRLADRFRHFARLAVAETDPTLLVADDDEGGKAETTATLHHLGDAVDVDELVNEFAVALLAITTAAFAVVPAVLCHILVPFFFSGSTG